MAVTKSIFQDISFGGTIDVDGKVVKNFRASISTRDIDNPSITCDVMNHEIFRVNRDAVKQAETELEDMVYAEQERLKATMKE